MHKELAQILGRFKIDWRVLRAVMLNTGAVISGSAALAVLQPGEFVPQDLDIYVTSKNLATVIVFLNEQGYDVQLPMPGTPKSEYPRTTIILTLKNNTGEKIDLIATIEPHVVHPITQFHSTCVMNFITYYGIVCLYPEWTMGKVGLVRAAWTDGRVINKYRGCGFAMVYTSAELEKWGRKQVLCGTDQCCLKTRQEFHNDPTLFIPFEDQAFNVQTEEQRRVEWVLKVDHECDKEV